MVNGGDCWWLLGKIILILVLVVTLHATNTHLNITLSIVFIGYQRPEGGWEEPKELDLFMQHGFQKVSLGTRVLRSDVAVVSLLALAHEVCSKSKNG
jgi:RsmE family RNA methyltransferase